MEGVSSSGVSKRYPICSYCGACAAFVPNFDQFKEDEAMTRKGCAGSSSAGSCYTVCPRSYAICSDDRSECVRREYGNCHINPFNNLEGREGNTIGCYDNMISARSVDENISEKGQDGGVVTALLDMALKGGFIDSAVVAGKSDDEPWRPEPVVATGSEELSKSSGSKYTACPSILGVWDAIDSEYEKIALVGTPCNIEAMRKVQSLHDRSLGADRVKILIGLFCTETFWYKDLLEYLDGMGVDINKVVKFDIGNGKFKIYTDAEVKEVPIKDLEPLARSACNVCNDFSSEFADLSAGSVGSDDGWTTLVIRTQVGQELVDMAIEKGLIETKELSSDAVSKINKISINKKMKNWGNMLQQIECCSSCNSSPMPSVLITH